jgi:hypothetical protein
METPVCCAVMNAESALLPIGHYNGVKFRSAVQADHVQLVRVGSRFHELSDTQFGTWVSAHGRPDVLDPEESWTRAKARPMAEALAVSDFDAAVAGLIEMGLLVELSHELDEQRRFARTHRLTPTLTGLGNSADEPWHWRIGLFNQPFLGVPLVVYETWQWSAMTASLWEACQATTQAATKSGSTDPENTDPDLVLTEFMSALHLLLSSSAAILDVPFRIAAGALR